MRSNSLHCISLVVSSLGLVAAAQQPDDPLPSWRDGTAKRSIEAFVASVTTTGSPDFVPIEQRTATFDNDGTLWPEKPAYFQLLFAIDRVKALAPRHPEWKHKEPFKSLLAGDMKAVAAGGRKAILEIIAVTHAGMTTEEFELIVADWIATAKHPRFQRPYTDLAYQPMLELMTYLRSNGFRVYIASGGGVEFMRPWAERVYGVPPEQVIGSSIKTELVDRDGDPVLMRLPEADFIDDKAGKVIGIHRFLGRRPLAAFGNSEGDRQMLEWTMAGDGPRFALLVHHTDAEREWAYDRNSPEGRLDQTLDEARTKRWTIVDMQKDWKQIFRFEEPAGES